MMQERSIKSLSVLTCYIRDWIHSGENYSSDDGGDDTTSQGKRKSM